MHLNLALREPLLPDDDDAELDRAVGRPRRTARPWTAAEAAAPAAAAGARGGAPHAGGRGRRTGPSRALGRRRPVAADRRAEQRRLGAPARSAAARCCSAPRAGWPRTAPTGWSSSGRPTLSRPVSALLADPACGWRRSPSSPRWADAGRTSAQVVAGLPPRPVADAAGSGARRWQRAAGRVGRGGRRGPGRRARADRRAAGARHGRGAARRGAAGAGLVHAGPRRRPAGRAAGRHHACWPTAASPGIDGTISTAVGAALAHGGPAFALMGDLTFLHDLTGLLLGEGEPVPDLTVVVPDNDGGGIFAQLEPGEDRYARDYRRVFGTPHGRDLVAVARGPGLGRRPGSSRAGRRSPAALALGGPAGGRRRHRPAGRGGAGAGAARGGRKGPQQRVVPDLAVSLAVPWRGACGWPSRVLPVAERPATEPTEESHLHEHQDERPRHRGLAPPRGRHRCRSAGIAGFATVSAARRPRPTRRRVRLTDAQGACCPGQQGDLRSHLKTCKMDKADVPTDVLLKLGCIVVPDAGEIIGGSIFS